MITANQKEFIVKIKTIYILLLLTAIQITYAGELISLVETNASHYTPGDTVHFRLSFKENMIGKKLLIKYYHLSEIIDEEEYQLNNIEFVWNWIPPKSDFKGYLAEIVIVDGENEIDKTTIAIDVSSSWKYFPRYGFLSKFPEMNIIDIQEVISKLNRYHINGIQFYDWHYKHHMPLKGTTENPAPYWNDIANRINYYSTIKTYIDESHTKNMKAMAYNLLYGAYSNSYLDGVKDEWGLYMNANHSTRYMYQLPSSWASNLYFMDPFNAEWKSYIFEQEKKVFEALPFDGWHIDQVGDPHTVYNYKGEQVVVNKSFGDYIREAKSYLNVDLVMNAVNQYGQYEIANAPVDFLYSEVWGPNDTYADLVRIINNNKSYSAGKLNSVLAAYVNYQIAEKSGLFNEPGVLLANSVIFAAGGSHLELGEHMLGKEYFPNDNLKMSEELEQHLVKYYDFLTAYENILRDSLEISNVEVKASGQYKISSRQQTGSVWYFSKTKEDRQIIHLINLTKANTLNWRDENGTMPEPDTVKNLPLNLSTDYKVKTVWAASPDFNECLPINIDFLQSGKEVSFTLPALKYWSVIILEYENVTGVNDQEYNSENKNFSLFHNYPNPFNSDTVISFYTSNHSSADLKIFDSIGNSVFTTKIESKPGVNTAIFNSSGLSSGIYYYSVSTGKYKDFGKMLLLK